VPLGKTLHVTDIYAATAQQATNQGIRWTLRSTSDEGVLVAPGLFIPFKELVLANTAYNRQLTMPVMIPATADIKFSAVSTSADMAVGTCGLTGWLE